MEKKEKELKALFGRYINDIDKPGLCEAKKGGQFKRLIVSISCSEKSAIRFSTELCDHISVIFPLNENFLVDSLSPLPVLSAAMEDLNGEVLKKALKKIIGPKKEFRVVCAIGAVEFGKIGKSNIMSYGSSGQIVSSVIEGLVLLPPRYSWGDETICNLLKTPLSEAQEISGSIFYKIEEV